MVPAFVGGVEVAARAWPFLYFPNGVQMDTWHIETAEHIARLPEALPRALEPLATYRDDITVLGGLTVDGGRAHGDGPGDHGRAGASYLTGAHPKKTFGKDIQAGVSVDQYVAQKIGTETRFASLELGCEEGIQGGNCDNGYSCAYSNSISWRTPSTPNPPEVRPRAVFERLFGAGEIERDPVKRARLEKYKKSVLDSVLDDAQAPRDHAWVSPIGGSSTNICTRSAISRPASRRPRARTTSSPRSIGRRRAFRRITASTRASCST